MIGPESVYLEGVRNTGKPVDLYQHLHILARDRGPPNINILGKRQGLLTGAGEVPVRSFCERVSTRFPRRVEHGLGRIDSKISRGGAGPLDPYIVLGSAVIGLLVGVTGAGGGALMTPMLILLFGVKPSTAISSDLVAAVVMRPIGAAVHWRQGTINLRLVGWMTLGSVPMAFFGAYLLHLIGNAKSAQNNVQIALGAALLVGAAAMILRYGLDRRARPHPPGCGPRPLRPTTSDSCDRDDRRDHRRDHLRWVGVSHDCLPLVPLSDDWGQPARGDRLSPSRSSDGCGRPGGSCLWSRRAVSYHVAHHRKRPCCARRIISLFESTRPLHPTSHHLRDPCLGAQVRRGGNHRSGVDAVLHPARRRHVLAGFRPAVAERRSTSPATRWGCPRGVHFLDEGPRLTPQVRSPIGRLPPERHWREPLLLPFIRRHARHSLPGAIPGDRPVPLPPMAPLQIRTHLGGRSDLIHGCSGGDWTFLIMIDFVDRKSSSFAHVER